MFIEIKPTGDRCVNKSAERDYDGDGVKRTIISRNSINAVSRNICIPDLRYLLRNSQPVAQIIVPTRETYWNASQTNQKRKGDRVTYAKNDETVKNLFVELDKAADAEVGG